MIGLFKNNGRAWHDKPKQVNDHDFRTDAIGVALPYGIYRCAAQKRWHVPADDPRSHPVIGRSASGAQGPTHD
ncbi:MAG: ISAzo13-like element transposase-related protein [Acidiferrobacteraceae bacterium]